MVDGLVGKCFPGLTRNHDPSCPFTGGDRIRWTRNDETLELVNSGTAEITRITDGRVSFRIEDRRTPTLSKGDSQLRHLDHASASTVHSFRSRTVANVVAAMESNHPNLTTQKSFYVEISHARGRAGLVTDERISAPATGDGAESPRLSRIPVRFT